MVNKITSKKSVSFINYILPFILFVVALFLIFNSNQPYLDLVNLGFSLMAIILGCALIYDNISYSFFTVSRDTIQIKQLFRTRKISIDSKATYFNIIKVEHKELIIISTGKTKITVAQYVYSNYKDMKAFAQNHFIHNPNLQPKIAPLDQSIRLIFLILGIGLISIFDYWNNYDIDQFKPNLKSLDIKLAAPLTIEQHNNSMKQYLRFRSTNYPDFIIYSNKYLNSVDKSIIQQAKSGDILTLSILEEDLYSKLLKTKEPKFWTKHFLWQKIETYAIEFNGKAYQNLNVVKEQMKSDEDNNYFYLIMGIMLILGALTYPKIRRKNKGVVENFNIQLIDKKHG